MPSLPKRQPSRPQVTLLTGAALVAFAGNSILCRLALRDAAIDPWSFTAIRIASGALLLLPLLRTPTTATRQRWQPLAAVALLIYALAFSIAYVSLSTGTGALLLFGSVQITMIGAGLRHGERPTKRTAAGALAAMGGVVWLLLPGATSPDPIGAMAMIVAGIAWGGYSLLGRRSQQATLATARNFALAAPIAVVAMAANSQSLALTTSGVWLAIASGAATSAMGYVVWYVVLPQLSATSAAVAQLAVPVLAALGGVALLGETASLRLLIASSLTIGGVAVAVTNRR